MFETPDGPEVVQAVSLGLAVMRICKRKWPIAKEDLPPDLTLSVEQIALLDKYDRVLANVHPTVAEDADSLTTVYACTECGHWGYVIGTAPKVCNLRLHCGGTVVKASAAIKSKAV
mgnify:CR=1 FL=1